MLILGLDTATKTGWALYDSHLNRIVESGVQSFAKARGESNGMMFLRFRKWLTDLLNSWPVKFVVYEKAHHRGGAATEICVNLSGRVQEACDAWGIDYLTVQTTRLKKWATGKGNSGKEAMIEEVAKRFDLQVKSDDEADAILLAAYGAEEAG
jgi:Holliday junction resolvasome RuvABC endonuclease subunit